MNNFKTVANAIETLRNKGYSLDFEVGRCELIAYGIEQSFSIDEFEVNEIHCIDANADQNNPTVVYAIETTSHNKGIVEGDYRILEGKNIDESLYYKLNRFH